MVIDMKKIILCCMVIMVTAAMITGCSNAGNTNNTNDNNQVTNPGTTDDNNINNNSDNNTDKTVNQDDSVSTNDNDTAQQNTTTQDNDQNPNASKITATGEYVGQADSNFIEISVNEVAGETTDRVFMLSENVKENFDSFNLKTGDKVQFVYEPNEYGQLVIFTISKI